jgi:hypothetical protein
MVHGLVAILLVISHIPFLIIILGFGFLFRKAFLGYLSPARENTFIRHFGRVLFFFLSSPQWCNGVMVQG